MHLQIDYLNVIYLLMYIPMSFISMYTIEKYGMRTAMLVGVTLQLIGFILRCFVNYNFIYLSVGQTFVAAGFPFVFDMQWRLSSVWFIKR